MTIYLTDIHQKVHKTFIALRQFYNTTDTTRSLLPYGTLGGDGFGMTYLKLVLIFEDCQTRFGYTLNELEHRYITANTSANKAEAMAAFVRWATDIAIEFLCDDPAQVATRAKRGVEIMTFVQEALQQHTLAVYNAVERDGEREEQVYRLLLLLLGDFLSAIHEHHKKVSESDAGIEELLTVGDETTFVRRGSEPAENMRERYTTIVVNYGMAKHQFIDMAEQVITRQLKEQKHPMPVEYAVRTLAPAIKTLNPALLQRLPVKQWLEWTKALQLEAIGEEILSGVKATLASVGEELHAPRDLTSEWTPNAAPTLQSAAFNATCLLAGMGDPNTQTTMPTTLFGEGWAGVQLPQDPKSSQDLHSDDTSLPSDPKKSSKETRAQRSARMNQEWKEKRRGRGAAADKSSKLANHLRDFMESKATDEENSLGGWQLV
jgi:hypothetical protein